MKALTDLVRAEGLAVVLAAIADYARERAEAAKYAGLSDDADAWAMLADAIKGLADACAARGLT